MCHGLNRLDDRNTLPGMAVRSLRAREDPMPKSTVTNDDNLPQKQKQFVRDDMARRRLRDGEAVDADLDVPSIAREAREAEIPSAQEWIAAENSRPDLPDENADGLDRLSVEVQRKAGDQPLRPRRPQ
jgi:hypothetical protein